MNSLIAKIPFWVRGCVVALVLTMALAWMVYDRVSLLQHGKEIVLKTRPVDPRSLFRGHYARLNYDVSNIQKDDVSFKVPEKLKRRDVVYVVFKPGAEGYWVIDHMSNVLPETVPGKVFITARIRYNSRRSMSVRYGIERYFAPKKQALKLERQNREIPVGVIVRVSTKGVAAISGLMLDGKKIYDEPLF